MIVESGRKIYNTADAAKEVYVLLVKVAIGRNKTVVGMILPDLPQCPFNAQGLISSLISDDVQGVVGRSKSC